MTPSHNLTYVNAITCATGYLIQEQTDILEFSIMLLSCYYNSYQLIGEPLTMCASIQVVCVVAQSQDTYQSWMHHIA